MAWAASAAAVYEMVAMNCEFLEFRPMEGQMRATSVVQGQPDTRPESWNRRDSPADVRLSHRCPHGSIRRSLPAASSVMRGRGLTHRFLVKRSVMRFKAAKVSSLA